MSKIIFDGTAEEAKDLVRGYPAKLIGGSNARKVLTIMGMALLADIKREFIRASRGEKNAFGIKWKPLKPETIASRRVGPKQKDKAIKEREKIRKREFRKLVKRYSLSLPEDAAKKRAAIVAGQKATRITGQTKTQTLGGRDVQILADTGILLNSLSAGTPDTEHSPPEGQIFEFDKATLKVGTNVPYAATHQHGRGAIPARPFLPDDDQIPQDFKESYSRLASRVVLELLRKELER